MAQQFAVTPEPPPQPRGMRRSTLLLILALVLLILAVAGFIFSFGRGVVTLAAAPAPTPTDQGKTSQPPPLLPTETPSGSGGVGAPDTPTPASQAPMDLVPMEIQSGQTITSIASQAGISVSELMSINGLTIRPNVLFPGQIILVPEVILTPDFPPVEPVGTATATATATATPTPTFTPTPVPTATPPPVGRFTMGFPLTMTVGSRQIVYVEIVDASTAAAIEGGSTSASSRILVAVGQPDVLTTVVRELEIFPEMLAVLDAPAFDVQRVGPEASGSEDWRRLRNGSAAWTWNVTARQHGQELLTLQVFGRESTAEAPSDVLFEAQGVAVLDQSALEALLNSALVRTALGPMALLLSFAAGASGIFMRRKERLDRPVKGLPGLQVKQLHAALLSAFPTDESLAQMVRIQLDQNLEVISTGRNLSDITYDLIRWAEANGQIDRLIAGALAENPGNPDLQELARKK